MMRKIIVKGWLLPALLASFFLKGQDSLLVTKNFKFNDGIYFSLEAFWHNSPDVKLGSIEAVLFTNPQTFLTQVETIRIRETNREIPLSDIEILCLDGIPYIRLHSAEAEKTLTTFAGMKVRGKLCYFSYPKTITENIPISAYNPKNGRPFRTGYVEKEREEMIGKLLVWETGEIYAYTRENFLHLIKDDQALSASVKEIPPDELEEKLFKCLLIYVDRNPVYVTTGELQK